MFRLTISSTFDSACNFSEKFKKKKKKKQLPGLLYQYIADSRQDLVLWLLWGMGEIYSFLYQVMSPVVKQCDRKSVQLWWLSSVLIPSTFSSRSSSKVHLRCTVCSLPMTHPQENELYGAGSLANKHFTICRVYWSTLLTYSLNPQTTNTNSDKPILFYSACKAQSVKYSLVFLWPFCVTHVMTITKNTQQWDIS